MAEQAVGDLKVCQYLEPHIGERVSARIRRLSRSGMEVHLDPFNVSGFVPMSAIGDRPKLKGPNLTVQAGKRSLSFSEGRPVNVRIKDVDFIRLQVSPRAGLRRVRPAARAYDEPPPSPTSRPRMRSSPIAGAALALWLGAACASPLGGEDIEISLGPQLPARARRERGGVTTHPLEREPAHRPRDRLDAPEPRRPRGRQRAHGRQPRPGALRRTPARQPPGRPALDGPRRRGVDARPGRRRVPGHHRRLRRPVSGPGLRVRVRPRTS